MKRRVIITGPAETDTLSNHRWWADNHSPEQALRWLEGIYAAMFKLAYTAETNPLADEKALCKAGIQQVNFGLGSRPTHRIIYTIDGGYVVIYRVRAFKQDELDLSDLD